MGMKERARSEKEAEAKPAPTPAKPRTGEKFVHEQDALIREFGFTVHSRPRNGPVVWIRRTKLYTQEQALASARNSRAEADEKAKRDRDA